MLESGVRHFYILSYLMVIWCCCGEAVLILPISLNCCGLCFIAYLLFLLPKLDIIYYYKLRYVK